jgi:hypothetical protein
MQFVGDDNATPAHDEHEHRQVGPERKKSMAEYGCHCYDSFSGISLSAIEY